MNSFRIDFEHRDLVRMYKALERAGASPRKALNKGTSKGIAIVKRFIKGLTPVGNGPTKGSLKNGLTTKTERSSVKGKKVREVTIKGGEANNTFQKPIKHPGVLGGKSNHAYYPNSIEFGFLARAPGGGTIYVKFLTEKVKTRKGLRDNHRIYYADTGNRVPSQKVEGQRYMQRGGEAASEPAKKAMIETMEKELDRIWKNS